MSGLGMSANEEMVREQLDRIISRAELRVEQWSIHASALQPYGDQAKRARSQVALALIGLAKLKTYRNEFSEPRPRRFTGG
jgi:hypothetical protein